jgi:hypothetical protein
MKSKRWTWNIPTRLTSLLIYSPKATLQSKLLLKIVIENKHLGEIRSNPKEETNTSNCLVKNFIIKTQWDKTWWKKKGSAYKRKGIIESEGLGR